MNTLKEIADRLKHVKSVRIYTHMRPDGDTVGCAVALSHALNALGIVNEVLNETPIPEKYLFLTGAEKIKTQPTFSAQACVFVDTSDYARIGSLQTDYLANAKKTVTFNIDHHVSNTRYAQYNFVRDRASNCENIAELIAELGVPYDKNIANALLTGMVSDSGAFSHADVNGDTFRAAALCADAGADVQRITYETYKKQSRARAQFYVEVLQKLRFEAEEKLAVALVTQEQLKRYGLGTDATEGIVDFGLNVDTVEISVCLLEMKAGQYKVSLRSKGKANVNEIAARYGGGGHVLASGCMLFGDAEEVIDKLSFETRRQLDL